MMTQHRDFAPEALAAVAWHEAGHAVANVIAYRKAQLPGQVRPSVKYAAIVREEDGKAGGNCYGGLVYHARYAARLPGWNWRDAMEWQIVIDMAGGVAEAIHRGERRQKEVFWFAMLNCGAGGDLEAAERTLEDLRALTGRRDGRQYARRALRLLLARWDAVEAIAAALIRDGHIDGEDIEDLVNGVLQ